MKAAAVQMSSQDGLEENLKETSRLVHEAKDLGARLVCLPEGFAYLGPEAGRARMAESLERPGPIVETLLTLAQKHDVFIIGGGMPEISDDAAKPFNTSVVVTPNGEVSARYRKIHLFDVELDDGTELRETQGSSAGTSPQVVAIDSTVVGLSICYDLRFPRVFEAEREQGATILTVPAAFTKSTGAAHWHALLRARAIETQCWLVAPAQSGSHPGGRQTYGHTLFVSPWGEVVGELPDGPGVSVWELDPKSVLDVRRQMPIWAHRRSF